MEKLWKHTTPKLLFTLLAMALLAGFSNIDDKFIIELSARLENFNKAFPREKIYLQLDRTVFQPGEDLWFKGYILDHISLRPIERSKTLFVEVVGENGDPVLSDKFMIKNGYSVGDLTFPEVMDDGHYKVIAYTSWMKNYKDAKVFEKNVFVKKLAQTEMILPSLVLHTTFEEVQYNAGSEVALKVKTQAPDVESIAEITYEYRVLKDREIYKESQGYALNNGEFYIRFTLPEKINDESFVIDLNANHKAQVINVKAEVPIDRPIANVQFFPEGGDIIKGIPNRIAFRVEDTKGQPLEVSGWVENNAGRKAAEFSTMHKGIGYFELTPIDSLYRVFLKKEEGKVFECPLPEIKPEGINLKVLEQNKRIVNLQVASSEVRKKERIYVTATVRGQLYWSVSGNLKDVANLTIPTNNLPTGIAQITVFDSRGIPKAERLVFVNAYRKLDINVDTDKKSYRPREAVTATISVTNQEGEPVPANLSLSAFDNMYSFLNKKDNPNIFTHLFLQSEIELRLDDPGYYFNENEAAARDLDLLMMTYGWRRFDFTKIQTDSLKYKPTTHRDFFEGQVLNNWGKPAEGAKISIVQSGTYENIDLTAGIDGKFYFDKTTITHIPTELLFSAVNHRGKDNVRLSVQELNADQFFNHIKPNLMEDSLENISPEILRYQSSEYSGDRYTFLKDLGEYQLLKEIMIQEKRLIPEKIDEKVKEFRSFSTDSKMGEDLKNSDDFLGILRQVTSVPYVDYINGNVYFRSRRGGQVATQGGFALTRFDDATGAVEQQSAETRYQATSNDAGALFILNGTPVGNDYNVLNYLRPEMIEFITVLKGSRASTVYGGRATAGAVFITTKKTLENEMINDKANFTIVNNYAFPREFPAKRYDTEEALINIEPDLRNTIHWEPEIIVDQSGKATVQFYNSDRNSWINLKVEGITPAGLVGSGTSGYRIDKDS